MARDLRLSNAAAVSAIRDQQERLYRAYSQSYRSEANRRQWIFVVDVAFSLLAVGIAAIAVGAWSQGFLDALTAWSPFVALAWLFVRDAELLGQGKKSRRTAVTIQEQFDLTFWKPDGWTEQWNSLLCGHALQPRDIEHLSNAYEGPPLTCDYWVDTSDIPANEAALLRICQSAGWSSRGHARYRRFMMLASSVGVSLVMAMSVLLDLSARSALAVLVAVAPLLVGRLQSGRIHGSLALRLETLESHIRELLCGPTSATTLEVRAAQDELCRVRYVNCRIPTWIYNRYAAQDRNSIDAAIARDADHQRSMRPPE